MLSTPVYSRHPAAYGLTPSREYMASIGYPPSEEKETTGKLVTRLVSSLVVSLLVGPYVVKQFSPDMPYKRRLGISVATTMVINYAARTINPK